MNEYWRDLVTVICVAVVGWFARRIVHLDKNAVTRDELQRALDKIDKKIDDKHEENKSTLERVDERVYEMWKAQK